MELVCGTSMRSVSCGVLVYRALAAIVTTAQPIAADPAETAMGRSGDSGDDSDGDGDTRTASLPVFDHDCCWCTGCWVLGCWCVRVGECQSCSVSILIHVIISSPAGVQRQGKARRSAASTGHTGTPAARCVP